MIRIALLMFWLVTILLPGVSEGEPVWGPIPLPPNGDYCTALAAGGGFLYAAVRSAEDAPLGVYRTPLDAAGSWEFLSLSGRAVHDILTTGTAGQLVLVAATGDTLVYRSTNAGESWHAAAGFAGTRANTLAWDGDYSGRMYCAIRGPYSTDYLYTSTDRGAVWTMASSLGQQNYLESLAVPRDGSAMVYRAGYNGFWESPVHRSSDGGSHWLALQPIPPYGPGQDLDLSILEPTRVYELVDGAEIDRWEGTQSLAQWSLDFYAAGIEMPPWSPGVVYAAGVAGDGSLQAAYRAEDAGSWSAMNLGLPPGPGSSPDQTWWKFHLVAAGEAPLLFFSTWSRGLWMADLADLAGIRISEAPWVPDLLTPPSPNPSTGKVTFGLVQVRPDPVRLVVTDAMGRLVRDLGTSRSGQREGSWDRLSGAGRPVPAGCYVIHAFGRRAQDAERVVMIHVDPGAE